MIYNYSMKKQGYIYVIILETYIFRECCLCSASWPFSRVSGTFFHREAFLPASVMRFLGKWMQKLTRFLMTLFLFPYPQLLYTLSRAAENEYISGELFINFFL